MARFPSIPLLILAIAVCAAVVCASPTEDPPSAQFIAEALHAQEIGCGASLEVTFNTEFGPAGHRRKETIHYIRTPDVLVARETAGSNLSVKIAYDRKKQESRKLITGTVTSSSGSSQEFKAGSIGTISHTPFLDQDFPETTRYCIHEGPLSDVIGRGSVSSTQEEIDGAQCWRVDIPSTRKGIEKYWVWVDPNAGFCPRLIHIFWKDNPVQVISFKDYREVKPDIWFPMKQTVDLTTAEQDLVHVENTVTDVQVGKTIAECETAVTFPSGTTVTLWQGPTRTTVTIP